jgi:hypothetical protein
MYTVNAILAAIEQFFRFLDRGRTPSVDKFLKSWVRARRIRPALDFVAETRPLLETAVLLKRFPQALDGQLTPEEREQIRARARLHNPWVTENRRVLYRPGATDWPKREVSTPVHWAATFEKVNTGMNDAEILKAVGRPVKQQGTRKCRSGVRRR